MSRVAVIAIACAIPAVTCSKSPGPAGPPEDRPLEPTTDAGRKRSTSSVSLPPPAGKSHPADTQPAKRDLDGSSTEDVGQQKPESSPVGCWERTFGAPPAPEALDSSLVQVIPDCPDCPRLHAGPLATGLHPEVLRRLHTISQKLPEPPIPEPVMWVNSGARDGPPSKSMHNQGLAVDLVICGLNSPQTAEHLRKAGFACVIEYYDGDGNPCNVAHGDLRGTKWAKGAYAPGGWKSQSCPKRGVSKGEDCQNQRKADWSYDRRQSQQ